MREVSFGSATPTVLAEIGTTTWPAAIGSPAMNASTSLTSAFCKAVMLACSVARVVRIELRFDVVVFAVVVAVLVVVPSVASTFAKRWMMAEIAL
jgi:hypothetical protein